MKRKRLPGKTDPAEIYKAFRTAIRYQEDPEGFEKARCTKINGGYICELGDYFRAYDCRRESTFAPIKCILEAEGSQFDKDSIYLAYLGVIPTREGYGSKFYSDLEKYLKNYRDIKRITLHSKWSAMPFWEKMGYERLYEPEIESDLYWWDFYTLPRYRKFLPTKGKRLKTKKYYPFKEFHKMIEEIPEFHPLQKRLPGQQNEIRVDWLKFNSIRASPDELPEIYRQPYVRLWQIALQRHPRCEYLVGRRTGSRQTRYVCHVCDAIVDTESATHPQTRHARENIARHIWHHIRDILEKAKGLPSASKTPL